MCGVPPKSPDHQEVNTSRISTQTHQEARRPTMSGGVWHCRPLPERSASVLVPPQRCDTGADTLLLTGSVFKAISHETMRLPTGTASPRAEARVPRSMRRPSSMVTIIILPPTRETPLPANAGFLERP